MTPTREDLLSEREAAIQERIRFVKEADKLRSRIAELETQLKTIAVDLRAAWITSRRLGP